MKYQVKKIHFFSFLGFILLVNMIFLIFSFAAEKETNSSSNQKDLDNYLANIPVCPNSEALLSLEQELEELIRNMEMISGISSGEVKAYITSDKPEKVVKFYLGSIPRGNWERTLNLTFQEKGGIIVWKKEKASAQVFIIPQKEKTIILLGCAIGQEESIRANIEVFTENDGLADRSVMDIVVTPEGIAWISTRAGVSRFDGKDWTNYTKKDGLPSNYLTAVALDQNNLPWVGTEQAGCAYFDGAKWQQFKDIERVSAIDISATGDIWFGSCNISKGGVYHFDGERLTWYKKLDGIFDVCVNAVAIDLEGKVWVATKKGLSCFDGNSWVNYTVENGLADNRVNDVVIDQDNRVWIGTLKGLTCFDGINWHTYTTEDGLVNLEIMVIAVAPDNSLWIGTIRGLSHLEEGVWQNYTEENGLPDNKIISLFAANDGKIWIGTPFNGLAILEP